MSITALDIQQEGFEHSLRGYDVEQVDVFLEHVAREVDAMNKQIEELEAKVSELEAEKAELAESVGAGQAAESDAESTQDLKPAVAASAEVDQAELDAVRKQLEAAEARLEAEQKRTDEASARAREAEKRAVVAEKEAKEALAKVAPLEEQLAEKNDKEAAISQAFIAAQKAADSLKEEAREEGERVYRESDAKARELIRQALTEKQRIYNEIDALSKSRDRFRDEYKKLLAHFSADADDEFRDMQDPTIPDDVVSSFLPNADDIEIDANGVADVQEYDDDTIPAADAGDPGVDAPSPTAGSSTINDIDAEIDEVE